MSIFLCNQCTTYDGRISDGSSNVCSSDLIVDLDPPKKPCSECPWRLDIETGIWPVEKFIDLTRTAYDMSDQIFTCHKSAETHPIACAGFLERGRSQQRRVGN